MKLNFNVHLVLQLIFIALQTLLPAFLPSLTGEQKGAIALCLGGMQAALGMKGLLQDPAGNPLKMMISGVKKHWSSDPDAK